VAPHLRAISPDATPEEVAAIVAALAVLESSAVPATGPEGNGGLDEWVRAARLRARRAPLQRGPWRMSGRLGRRSRV
jgi:hypothetical protein